MKLVNKALLLLLLGPVGLRAQSFNIAEDLGYQSNYFERVIVHNDTIVALGTARTDSLESGVLIALYDSTGQRLASQLLTDFGGEGLYMLDNAGGFAPANGGGYVIIAYSIRFNAIFIKLDEHLNEEFRHEYTDIEDVSNYNYRSPIPLDNGYLLYGDIDRDNGVPDPFVRIVDEQGQTVRLNFYGSYEDKDIYQDAQLLGDSILVAGGQRQVSLGYSKNFFHRIRISDGALLDSWESSVNADMGWLRQLVALEDGDIITFGQQPLEIIDWNTYIVQPMLTRFNSNYEVVWQRPIYRSSYHSKRNGLHEIKQVSDGYYVGSGHVSTNVDGNSTRTGWLFKFTAFGDSLWSRYYLPPFDTLNNPILGGSFFSFGELSSGNLVSGGEANGDGSQRRCWIIKTDANGCQGETPCEVLTDVAEAEPVEEPGMRVFPNPASRHLTVAWPGAAPTGTGYFTLYNMQGQAVWAAAMPCTPEVPLQLPELPPGVYALRVEVEGQVWVERVVIR
ncbi:MAG: T9SS type A sorting domain-containing protein [Phaeodactylibacter sp.]|uniref:T9SS type A sorting domain-containing protein n=1 Tax=Phaeodactylibacter sp. TaxID=1940289 RepID=UPI0032EEEEB5